MISMFTLGSDLQEIEVIRSALSEELTFVIVLTGAGVVLTLPCVYQQGSR